MHSCRNEIVVGVDGSDPSWAALDWAAEEAQLAGARLAVLHGQALAVVAGGVGTFYADTSEFDQALIDDAVHRVVQRYPGSAVRGEVVGVPAVAALLEASREARLVVVGSHSHSRVAGLLLGSTALQVALHSTCPAVVVRPTSAEQGPLAGYVVAAIDGSAGARAALPVAFAEASRRGVPLAAVYADPSDDSSAGLDLVEAEVARWTTGYPDVEVTHAVARGDAGHGLLHCTAGAELLVVGSRGHGGFVGLLLGSVSLAVVQRAECPVMVVHDEMARKQRHDAGLLVGQRT